MSDKETLVKFVSWNCKGLNGTLKRNKILTYIKGLGADMFLQETHLKNRDHTSLHKAWIGHIFHSSFNSKSRRVAVLIRKSVPFILTGSILDHQGRYVIVTGKLCDSPVILANIYAPNHDDDVFIHSLISSIPNLHSHSLIKGGDFTFAQDPLLDRSSHRQQTLTKSAKLIENFSKATNLVDPWRQIYSTRREYSCFFPNDIIHTQG